MGELYTLEMMKQEEYAKMNNLNLYEKEMPDHIEEIYFQKVKKTYPQKCDACPEKHKILFFLYVGDVALAKLCGNCKRRVLNAQTENKKYE